MLRELAQRNASGEIVTLRWNPVVDVLSLTVHRNMPDGCELVTADIADVPRDVAMDCFEHPYAYAAFLHSGSITLPERESTYATTGADYDADDDGDDEDTDGEYARDSWSKKANPNNESEV